MICDNFIEISKLVCVFWGVECRAKVKRQLCTSIKQNYICYYWLSDNTHKLTKKTEVCIKNDT